MKLFKKQQEASCQTCEFARLSADQSYLLCLYKGIMQPFDCCKKYTYSPFKRVPARNRPPLNYTEDDFAL